jgi:16S rRNA (guanine527-N7)-methyltransferase
VRNIILDSYTQLQRGLTELNLTLPRHAQQQLLDYLALLKKWNRAYNLTAVRDEEVMISRHLLDSLAIAPYLQGQWFADVGTGAGLPGIPLAIAFPDRHFLLIDSNGKKIRFITQVIAELHLPNVTAMQCRVEDWQPGRRVDAVLSRAFASLTDMAQSCEHLLTSNGALLAMKGVYPEQELRELPERYKVDACAPLQVPGETGQRHLVIIRPAA